MIASDRMLRHGAGRACETPTTVLRQHLLDGKLAHTDVALQVRPASFSKSCAAWTVNRFETNKPAILMTPSIEPKVFIAVEAISRAIERLPMSPRITASPLRRSEGVCCDVERVGDHVITRLDEGVRNASTDSLGGTGHDHRLAFHLHSFRDPSRSSRAACATTGQLRSHRQIAENPYSRALTHTHMSAMCVDGSTRLPRR